MRGQCNIYSDVTFHFYEAGNWCRSRKRAARDIPAWEAAVTPSTTRSRLHRGSREPGPSRGRSPPSDPQTPKTTRGWGQALGSSHCRCHLPHQRGRGNGWGRQDLRRAESLSRSPVLQDIPRQTGARHTTGLSLHTVILRNPRVTRHTVQGANIEMHQLVTKFPQWTCFLEEPSPLPSGEMVSSVPPCTELWQRSPVPQAGLVPVQGWCRCQARRSSTRCCPGTAGPQLAGLSQACYRSAF